VSYGTMPARENATGNAADRSGKSADVVVAKGPAETPGQGEARNRNDGEKRRPILGPATTPNRPSEGLAMGAVGNEP